MSRLVKTPFSKPGRSISEIELMDFLTLLLAFETGGLKLPRLLEEVAEGRVEAGDYVRGLALKYKVLERTVLDDYTALRKLADSTGSAWFADFLRGYSEVATTSGETARFVESYLEKTSLSLRVRLENMLKLVEGVYEGLMLAVFGLIALTVIPLTGVSTTFLSMVVVMAAILSYLIVLKISDNALTLSRLEHFASAILMSSTLVAILVKGGLLLHFTLVLATVILLSPRVRRLVRVERDVVGFLEEAFSMTRHGVTLDQVLHYVEFEDESLRLFKKTLLLGHEPGSLLDAFPALARMILRILTTPLKYTPRHEKVSSHVLKFVELVSEARVGLEKKGFTYMVYSFIFPATVFVTYFLVHPMIAVVRYAMSLQEAKAIAYTAFFNTYLLAANISGIGLFRSWKTSLICIGALSAIILFPSL